MRRVALLTSLVAVIVLALFTWSEASAGTASVKIGGTENFTPNALINSTFHFTPGPIMVRSGDTITFTNGVADPHTISVVSPNQVPASIDDVFNCQACNDIFVASGGTGVLGNGANNELMTAGDSAFIAPGPGSTLALRITAPAGTTLNYICAIHPWMQGTIRVR